MMEDFRDDANTENSASVDDFLRQLEAKEKDLHITADLSIEIQDSEFDLSEVPDFVAADLTPAAAPANAKKNAQATKAEQKLNSENAALKSQVSELRAERATILERSKQRGKEFENFKNRTERERRETFVSQVCNLATSMLPVLDNLDRALEFASSMPDDKRAEFVHFFEGIILVDQQILEILAGMGVQPIASVGEQFDPELHEAVALEDSEHFPPNCISQELLRGYRLGDKIIRHSMVKVAADNQTGSSDEQESGHETEDHIHTKNGDSDAPIVERRPVVDDEVEEFVASAYADLGDSERGS